MYISIYQTIYWVDHVFQENSILSIYLSIYKSIYLSIYLSINLSMEWTMSSRNLEEYWVNNTVVYQKWGLFLKINRRHVFSSLVWSQDSKNVFIVFCYHYKWNMLKSIVALKFRSKKSSNCLNRQHFHNGCSKITFFQLLNRSFIGTLVKMRLLTNIYRRIQSLLAFSLINYYKKNQIFSYGLRLPFWSKIAENSFLKNCFFYNRYRRRKNLYCLSSLLWISAYQ